MSEEEAIKHRHLALWLRAIQENEEKYQVRYGLILEAMAQAHQLGMKTGYRIDPKEPEWPVAFIELPTGQVSWHMPQFYREWDEHSTLKKQWRIDHWIESLP